MRPSSVHVYMMKFCLLVRKGKEEQWMETLKVAMESAEAKWLGAIPSVADVKTGDTWAACH